MLKAEAAANIDPDNPKKKNDPVEDLQAGSLSRRFSRCTKEFFSKGGHYFLKFPRAANVDEKTLLIAATMLLDMTFYDRKCIIPGFCC